MKKRYIPLKRAYRITPPATQTWVPERPAGLQKLPVYRIFDTDTYDISSLKDLPGIDSENTQKIKGPSNPETMARRLVYFINTRSIKNGVKVHHSLSLDGRTIFVHAPFERKKAHWQPRPLGKKLSAIYQQS